MQVSTREGMRLAFGILWLTSSRKGEAARDAIDVARSSLLVQLTPEERQTGVREAQDIIGSKPPAA